jgi:hypothetical protein
VAASKLISFRQTRCGVFAFGLVCLTALPAQAQLTFGFDRTAPAVVVNEEIVRQPDLWLMEVQLKPVRLVSMEVPQPTGGTRSQLVWYLAWRAVRRPLQGRPVDDVLPVNQLDPLPGPRQFVPEFSLVTYDNPETEIPAQILTDEILPSAMDEIRRIERGNFLNTVTAVQDLSEPVPVDAEQQAWIYGAATWPNVDPDTDFFKVILKGFSNGYEIHKSDDGQEQVWRKVLVQRFNRPGDRFDPDFREFQYAGNPQWIFQPDAPAPKP